MIENPEREMERLEKIKAVAKWTACDRWAGRTGAASELVVCVDLIRRGWDVFRAVSAQCVCDLIAIKGPFCLRIEVRTDNAKRGKLTAGKHGTYDVLAIVREFQIAYSPELPRVDE